MSRAVLLAISRIGVILLLLIPVLVYIITRFRRIHLLIKYTSITSGQIIEAWTTPSGISEKGQTLRTIFRYQFHVDGGMYMGIDTPAWGKLKAGDKTAIRYDPHQPEDSILWPSTKATDWLWLGYLWLPLVLGGDWILIALGLGCIYLGGIFLPRRGVEIDRSTKLVSIVSLILFGIIMLVLGITDFVESGFLAQNFLWSLWNGKLLFLLE